jgi:hypothetical protein
MINHLFNFLDIPLQLFLTPAITNTLVVGTRYQRVQSDLHMPPDISFPVPQNGLQTLNLQGITSTVHPVSRKLKNVIQKASL